MNLDSAVTALQAENLAQRFADLVPELRAQFPSLQQQLDGQTVAFLDGPAGTQVPQSVIDAISDYLIHSNANRHGAFQTATRTEAMFERAHQIFADFLGVDDPAEIFFGANMTSLTLALSRSLAQTWQAGDEIILTRLDHDANVSPWRLAAQDRGVIVKYIPVIGDDCRLDLTALETMISPKTRLIAVGAASNATGGINPVTKIAALAQSVGALTFVDAVHLGPHRLIDIPQWGADFVACSAYKFFGPHVGILWGHRRHLESLSAYKVRPASDHGPEKWMTGTQNHEGIAGAAACVEYLASVGDRLAASNNDPHGGEQDGGDQGGGDPTERKAPTGNLRRERLRLAFTAIAAYERFLTEYFLDGLAKIGGFQVFGVTDPADFAQRCSTFSVRHASVAAADLAYELGNRGIYTWSGHFYAWEFHQSQGLLPEGTLRIGFVHYNSLAEVNRVLEALAEAT